MLNLFSVPLCRRLWVPLALRLATGTVLCAPADSAPRPEMLLWYRQPAAKWLEAMPLGNGLMGAMVFGGIQSERIALNESTFWSGRPHDYNDPQAIQYFPRIRELVVARKFQEAEKMADEHFYGRPLAQAAFQPLGDLALAFENVEPATDYRRELDLATGVARIAFRAGDTTFTREVFVSYSDRVLVVRVSADRPGQVSVTARLQSPYREHATAQGTKLVMDGHWLGPITNNWLIASVEGKGLAFQAALAAQADGGHVEASQDALRVREANAVTFLVTAATSFRNYHDITGNPAAACADALSAAAKRTYATLIARHRKDFGALMNRVRLQVGEGTNSMLPTDARLQAFRDGQADPALEALAFQFGRYLLAASSRAGGQPANLQGIWDEAVSPPWGSKYTININTEMNYWPAEVCNLAECHQPLFDLLKDISVTGARTARLYYGCNGWVAHHNVDLWRGTAPVDAARYGMWPVGGAWLCQHLWEHYAFSGDKKFLREYYPVMRGAAQFLRELLVEDPEHHWLVTPFSMSPEHGYFDQNGKMAFLSPAPTLDLAIIRELFPHCIEASKVLKVDEGFRASLAAALSRLPPYHTNRLGYLQEWIEDWKEGGQGHNVSPNFTLYPGSSITLRGDPLLARAIERWEETRRMGGGWPTAWDISVWARLERGDKVAACLESILRKSLAPNLHNSGANQSDANFGYTAGVAEALLQSHANELSLLPALPAGWTEGSVTGLRARGGFEVSLRWRDGKLQSAEIANASPSTCLVRYGTKTTSLSVKPGKTVVLNGNLGLAQP